MPPQPAQTVELRPVMREDLEIYFAHEHDPESGEMAGVKPRDREAFFAHWERVVADESVTEMAILADGVLAGRVACFAVEIEGEQVWMLGYWIGREHWGQRIASRAVGQFLEQIDRRPLTARVSASNAASIRVLEGLGFAKVGSFDEPETDRYRAGPVHEYRLG